MNFSKKAQSYHDHALVQRELAHWLAEWLPAEMKGLKAIEFGAGTGMFTRHLVSLNAETHASDLFHTMIGEGSARVPKAKWFVVNAWNPSISDANYNYITSSALLQWAEDPVSVLSKWKALGTDDSTLIIGLFIDGSIEKLNKMLPRHAQFKWRSENEWIEIIESAGWKIKRSESLNQSYEYDNAISLLKILHGSGAIKSNQLSATQLKHIIQNYDNAHRSNDRISENWCFMRVEAKA